MGGEVVEVGEVNRVRCEVAVIAGELAEVAGNANGAMAVGEQPFADGAANAGTGTGD